MAPCLSTIQAATPKCPGTHTNMDPIAGRAAHLPCGQPMRWDATAEQWRCVSHGNRAFEVAA